MPKAGTSARENIKPDKRRLTEEQADGRLHGTERDGSGGGLAAITKVMIPYGTTEGLTARISEYMVDVIRVHDHEANAVDIEQSDHPGPEDYEGVIVGASIHMGEHEDCGTLSGRTAPRSNAYPRPSSP